MKWVCRWSIDKREELRLFCLRGAFLLTKSFELLLNGLIWEFSEMNKVTSRKFFYEKFKRDLGVSL
jgi:hypothetical protein